MIFKKKSCDNFPIKVFLKSNLIYVSFVSCPVAHLIFVNISKAPKQSLVEYKIMKPIVNIGYVMSLIAQLELLALSRQ